MFDEFTKPKLMKEKYRVSIIKNKEVILEKVYINIPKLTNVRNIRKYIEDCISDYIINQVL